jgi:hypothetical protein
MHTNACIPHFDFLGHFFLVDHVVEMHMRAHAGNVSPSSGCSIHVHMHAHAENIHAVTNVVNPNAQSACNCLEIIHLLLLDMQICSTKQTPQQAAQSFTCIQPSPLVPFRDATYTEVCTCLFAYIRTCVCRNPCACECVHAHRCKCLCVFM